MMFQLAGIIYVPEEMDNVQGDVTLLLRILATGQRDVMPQLVQLVYGELRRIASHQLRRERADHTLAPTALVHELYLRLVDQRRN